MFAPKTICRKPDKEGGPAIARADDSMSSAHPATQWALQTSFDSTQVDCTTTAVPKILDNKCKMLPGEKAAIMCVYDVVKLRPGRLVDESTHRLITKAHTEVDDSILEQIHALRLHAESGIPKPVMKAYKAVLREGLFG
jgi:hypothetical protein